MSEKEDGTVPPGGGTDRELGLRGVWIFAGALVAVSVVSFAVMFALDDRLKAARIAQDPPALPMPEANEPLPRPRAALQADPTADMVRFRADEERILTGYAWVDRAAGVARIPVDRALEIVLEKGLPPAPPLPAAALPAPVPAAKPVAGLSAKPSGGAR